MKKLLFQMFIIGLGSIILFGCSSSKEGERVSTTKENKEVIDSSALVKKEPVVQENKIVPAEIPNYLDSTKIVKENDIVKEDVLFAVQLGVFKEISNVEKFEKMVKKDFSIFIKTEQVPNTMTYKVTAGKFLTKEEAYKFRDYCVEKGYKDAWVIKIPKE